MEKTTMSEYANIYIKNLRLFTFRNYLEPYIVSLLFTKKDLTITPNCKIDLGDDEFEEYTRYVYQTTVKKAKERYVAICQKDAFCQKAVKNMSS